MSNLSDVMTLPLQIPETIPNDWSWRNLVELCNPKQWKTISNSDLTQTGYRVFGANGFIGFYHEFNHEDETISVTCRGATCGTVNLIPPRTYITGNSMCLDNLSREVSKFYLFYATQFRTFSDVISGSAQPQITAEGMKKVCLPIPPLPEQKKIASILTSVDEVIENTQRQIDKLQDLKKATMSELLTKGIGHTEFKDSELGRIPKSWEVVRFGEISPQKTLGTTERGGLTDKIPLIKMGDLKFGNVIVGANETVSKSKLIPNNFLSKGDFLFNTRNTPELVGKVGNFNSTQLAAYDNNLLKIDFTVDISSLFMGIQFNEPNLKRRLRRIVSGTTSVAAIYWNDLKNFYVLKPSISEQKNIYAVFESIDKQVKTLESKLAQTQSLKKSLMQDLLTGKVRVMVN
jgi:type I restriction enzyme S subunit